MAHQPAQDINVARRAQIGLGRELAVPRVPFLVPEVGQMRGRDLRNVGAVLGESAGARRSGEHARRFPTERTIGIGPRGQSRRCRFGGGAPRAPSRTSAKERGAHFPERRVYRNLCCVSRPRRGILVSVEEKPMKSVRKELWFETPGRRAFLNITPQVEAALKESDVQEGIALINAILE